MDLKMVAIYAVCQVHKYRYTVQDVNDMAINIELSILKRDVHMSYEMTCRLL